MSWFDDALRAGWAVRRVTSKGHLLLQHPERDGLVTVPNPDKRGHGRSEANTVASLKLPDAVEEVEIAMVADENVCEFCYKVLPTARGLAIHKGRLHKETALCDEPGESLELDRFEQPEPVVYQPVGGTGWCVVTCTEDGDVLDTVGPFPSSAAADEWVLEHSTYFNSVTEDYLRLWRRGDRKGEFSPTVVQRFLPLQTPVGVDAAIDKVMAENARLRSAIQALADLAIDEL